MNDKEYGCVRSRSRQQDARCELWGAVHGTSFSRKREKGSPWTFVFALLCASPASAADLDRLYEQPPQPAVAPAYLVPLPGPIVVAPAPVTLVVPRPAPPPLHYAPPPVYPEPPPLIAALPIVGPYLVPVPYGPPPATVLDTYDHRFDYNQ